MKSSDDRVCVGLSNVFISRNKNGARMHFQISPCEFFHRTGGVGGGWKKKKVITPICSFHSVVLAPLPARPSAKDVPCVRPLIRPNRGHNLHEN